MAGHLYPPHFRDEFSDEIRVVLEKRIRSAVERHMDLARAFKIPGYDGASMFDPIFCNSFAHLELRNNSSAVNFEAVKCDLRYNLAPIAPVVQWTERLTSDQKVVGSNPARGVFNEKVLFFGDLLFLTSGF